MKTKVNRTTQRERDKVFRGWEEFMRLSRNIMEEDEEESMLLARPPETYEAFPDEVDQEEELDDNESGESDESASEADALDLDEPPPLLDVSWFLQRSKVHLCWVAEEFRTNCDGATFVRPPLIWGSGLDEAKATEGSLCERCLDKYLSAAGQNQPGR